MFKAMYPPQSTVFFPASRLGEIDDRTAHAFSINETLANSPG